MEADQADRQQQVEELTGRAAAAGRGAAASGEQLTAVARAARAGAGEAARQPAAGAAADRRPRRAAAAGPSGSRSSAEAVAGRRGGVEAELGRRHGRRGRRWSRSSRSLTQQIESLAGQVAEAGEAVQALTGAGRDASAASTPRSSSELHGLQLQLGEAARAARNARAAHAWTNCNSICPRKYAEPLAPTDGAGGYQPADMDWDAVAEEIKELRDKIQRLGNVNLDAIAEQDELEQRQTFLTTQVNDLTESKQQLEELIDEINAESSVRFEQTFNAVREHFQGMFRKLFGGGKADIYLETELEDKPRPSRRSAPTGSRCRRR